MSGRSGGSRFLYEPFDAASARVETLEQVTQARWSALEQRLGGIEALLDRMERRMWMAVYGVAGVLATQGLFLLLSGGVGAGA
ncbi:GTA head formation protein, RCAP_rcc01685 family [Pontivivens insulae]|uniref:Gene transfer agent protein n=1 Tax=Pontivivens insulae TaxID=1639689 RepID=A0A2R8AAV2_9RHOB|nr:hypothetical protein [Pontivivens insulae]RED13078.1 hypothetical protein DFR53_2213 [Pontivivens insulae]SPF29170.1 hypothetical protein POI8812_01477 [Pontivivens insulae]